jgi:hypothetical protein
MKNSKVKDRTGQDRTGQGIAVREIKRKSTTEWGEARLC